MGGLINDSSTKAYQGSLLRRPPLLGAAFRQESKSQNKRNLVIFITPTIVQNETSSRPNRTSLDEA